MNPSIMKEYKKLSSHLLLYIPIKIVLVYKYLPRLIDCVIISTNKCHKEELLDFSTVVKNETTNADAAMHIADPPMDAIALLAKNLMPCTLPPKKALMENTTVAEKSLNATAAMVTAGRPMAVTAKTANNIK